MAENSIKDFGRKQTAAVTIGVPKSRNAGAEQVKVSSQPVVEAQQPAPQEGKRMGRPRTYEKRAKISMYLPEELKDKIVRIQHQNFKSSINDVMIEAVHDLLKKYGY